MADTARVQDREEVAHSEQGARELYSGQPLGPVKPKDGHKTLLRSNALFEYILETSVYPREPAPLRELREMSANHYRSGLAISPDEGQFLMLLLKIMNAKNTLELGVFTGYSLLCTALALPRDGKIIAMDINREDYELGVPFLKKAGVHHMVDFRQGKALLLLDELLQDDKNLEFFDFAFVDADKENGLSYHNKIMKLIKVNGIIVYDNTLWVGSVVADDDGASLNAYVKACKPFVLELNKALAEDPRIDISMVSLGDGITICKKLY